MITLTLLHPVQGTAVQSWTFKQEQTVRIGRAVDNEVVLYSAVVSRHHVELRHEQGQWHVHNLGVNGTFLEGRKIEVEPLLNGQTIRLARSGPNIKVSIEKNLSPAGASQRAQCAELLEDNSTPVPHPQSTYIEVNAPTGPSAERQNSTSSSVSVKHSDPIELPCTHERSPQSSLICIDCGEPMNVIQTIGEYKILKSLGHHQSTFQAWKQKKTFILRTLPPSLRSESTVVSDFREQLQQAVELNHGGIPRMIEVFENNGQSYLVYDMVYGTTLEHWVKDKGVLSLPLAVSWITEIARIVEYLHQLSPPFLHQGIKPANIVRPTIPLGDNHLLLVSFGQVNHYLSEETRSELDLAYRAPNVPPQKVSLEQDLYGLGATFLFMLTGADPYKYLQINDQSYRLHMEETPNISPQALEVIGGLLRAQDCEPIHNAATAIDKFLHLM